MDVGNRVLHVFHRLSRFERFLVGTLGKAVTPAFFKADFLAYKGTLSE